MALSQRTLPTNGCLSDTIDTYGRPRGRGRLHFLSVSVIRHTEVRVHVHGLAPAPHAPFSESTAGSLDWPQEQPYRFYGIGIAFVF
jgi:hypothetical protein